MAQEELEKKVELAWLLAFYGGMLTEKQREVLRLHCEEDLSLAEIAQEAGISRQGVHEQLSRAARKLFEMEEKLGVASRYARVQRGLEAGLDALRRGDASAAEQQLLRLLQLDQEESHGV